MNNRAVGRLRPALLALRKTERFYICILHLKQLSELTINSSLFTLHCLLLTVKLLEKNDHNYKTQPSYSEKAKYLCVNQALARDSAVTLFLTSTYSNYQTAMQAAGRLGQRLYLVANYLGIGCSGIGAYHDDETQNFLGTDNDILYVLAIGR